MSCRKFGAELRRLEIRPEEALLLPPDKKISLLDYFKDEGSDYIQKIHGGILLARIRYEEPDPIPKDDKAKKFLEPKDVQANRRQNFLKAVNLDVDWEKVPLGMLYYTLFLAIKNSDWYEKEKKTMAGDMQKYHKLELFDEYSEENTCLGEEFIKYMLFKNYEEMNNYFNIESCYYKYKREFSEDDRFAIRKEKEWTEKLDGKYKDYKKARIKETKELYWVIFKSTYKKKIAEVMESFLEKKERRKIAKKMGISLQDTRYLTWDLEELINKIGTQKGLLYKIDGELNTSDDKIKLTNETKTLIRKWYKTEIREAAEKVIVGDEVKKQLKEKINRKINKIDEIFKEKLYTRSGIRYHKDFLTVLQLEYELVNIPEVEEKIKSKGVKDGVNAFFFELFKQELDSRAEADKTKEMAERENNNNTEDEKSDVNEDMADPYSIGDSDRGAKYNDVFCRNEQRYPLLFRDDEENNKINDKIKNKFSSYVNYFKSIRGLSLSVEKKEQVLQLFFSGYQEITQGNLDDEVKEQIRIFLDTVLDAYNIKQKE
jgi:hypothetical protein